MILTVNDQLNGVLKNVIFPHHHAGEGFLICHGHFSDDEAKILFDTDSVLVVRIVWNRGILTLIFHQNVAIDVLVHVKSMFNRDNYTIHTLTFMFKCKHCGSVVLLKQISHYH